MPSTRNSFPPGVITKLGWYIYRLIDPRNGETFYVGKGKGDRVFHHANNELNPSGDEDEADLKNSRIKEIRTAGLEVGHLIHRHNIESEKIAFEIEATLIDAYPGLTNRVGGHGSDDFGCMHVEQIINEYAAEPFTVGEKLLLISIGKTYGEEGKSIYDAVRGIWKVNQANAESRKLVLAQRQGVVVGAFRPERWIPATKENFPWIPEDVPKRIGFIGKEAEPDIQAHYLQKRVPDEYRRRGAANPVRFVPPIGKQG